VVANHQRSRRRSRPLLIGRTGRSAVAAEPGLRFAGLRDTLPAALDFRTGLPVGFGRNELGLEVDLAVGVRMTSVRPVGARSAGVVSAGVLAVRVEDSASPGVKRLRSPRVCPVR